MSRTLLEFENFLAPYTAYASCSVWNEVCCNWQIEKPVLKASTDSTSDIVESGMIPRRGMHTSH